MPDRQPCGECDGCRWGGVCVNLRGPVPDYGLMAPHPAGATFTRSSPTPPEPATRPVDSPRRARTRRAANDTPVPSPEPVEAVVPSEASLDDDTALKMLSVWLRRLARAKETK